MLCVVYVFLIFYFFSVEENYDDDDVVYDDSKRGPPKTITYGKSPVMCYFLLLLLSISRTFNVL